MQDKLFRNTFIAFDPSRSKEKGLPPATEKADIPGQIGVGRDPTAKRSGPAAGTGGIGNATEQQRTYYQAQTLVSSDGIFSISVKPVKTLTMKGDNETTVTWSFKPA